MWKETKLVESERPIARNTLVATLEKIGKQYSVQFEVMPTLILKDSTWANVLHFTNITISSDTVSARIPAVWFYNGKIHIEFSSVRSSSFQSTAAYSAGKWISIKLTQLKDSSGYNYMCRINGKLEKSIVNKNPIDIPNVLVYMSNSWDKVQPGLIRNLSIYRFIRL